MALLKQEYLLKDWDVVTVMAAIKLARMYLNTKALKKRFDKRLGKEPPVPLDEFRQHWYKDFKALNKKIYKE